MPTSVQSFSEQSLIWLMNSSLYPAQYEPAKDADTSLDALYNNRVATSAFTAPARVAARLTYMVMLTTLIAPAGALYHGGQTIRHRIRLLFKTDSDGSIRQLKQGHRTALGKDLTVFSIAVSIVALKSLYPHLPSYLEILTRKVSSSAFLNICAAIPPLFFALIGAFLGADLLDNPVSLLHRNPPGGYFDPKIFNAVMCKSEFNRSGLSYSIDEIVINRYNRLIKCIKDLQAALPKDCKMPDFALSYSLLDIQNGRYTVKLAVCDWFEEQKETLEKRSDWANIQKIRNDFCDTYAQLETVVSYGYIINEKGSFDLLGSFKSEDSFAVEGIPVPLKLRQRDRVSSAFTLQIFKKMCASEWFYPSGYKATSIESSGSLHEVLEKKNPFIERTKVNSWTRFPKMSLAFITRLVANIANGLIAAPTGIVYHTVRSAHSYVLYLAQGKELQHKNWERAVGHISEAWVDATYILSAGHIISPKVLKGEGMLCLGVPFILPALTVLKIWTAICSVTAFYSALSFVPNFAYRDERAALFKSIALRQYCGYQASNGGLLSYSKHIDSPQNLTQMEKAERILTTDLDLLALWVKTGEEVTNTLYRIVPHLDVEEKKQFLSYISNNMEINYDGIIDLLAKKTKQANIQSSKSPSNALSATSNHSSPQVLIGEIEKLKNLKASMHDMRYLVTECCHAMHADALKGSYTTTWPLFPFSLADFKANIEADQIPDESSSSEWNGVIKRKIAMIKLVLPTAPSLPTLTEAKQALIARLHNALADPQRLPTCFEILGIQADASEDKIQAAYRKASLLIHPDKCPDFQYARLFFEVLEEARSKALKIRQH